MCKNGAKGWLERLRADSIEDVERQIEFRSQIKLGRQGGETPVATINLQPACLTQIVSRSGLGHQRFVFRHCAGKQRTDQPGRFGQTFGLRSGAECQQPGKNPRQERQMIVGLARAPEGDPQQRAEIGWKCRREYRVAFDDAGVAIGSLLADARAVD
jgi:hypothetical protein